MDNRPENIDQLIERLNLLTNDHNTLKVELDSIRKSIEDNKTFIPEASDQSLEKQLEGLVKKHFHISEEIFKLKKVLYEKTENIKQGIPRAKESSPIAQPVKPETSPKPKTSFLGDTKKIEQFIGTNLMNKVGILILVIGTGIGVKYAIDHQLISPLMRIVISYCIGIGLMVTSYRLKKNYNAFSAVLLSGALVIMYITTYVAYDLYGIFGQMPAYVLMLGFTVFTVFAAIQYNQQIIGILGLVGSYAIPFLLSQNSGNIMGLFTYMSIINAGILTISYFRYWKYMIYAAIFITWIIFHVSYQAILIEPETYKTEFFVFSLVFFLMFYVILLINKIIRKEDFNPVDTMAMIGNALIYFGINYSFLEVIEGGSDFEGAFTLGNAIIHLGVVYLLQRSKLDDQNTFFTMVGLVVMFLSIAIPIQFDGNWVTIAWSVEALTLFYLARQSKIRFYEYTAYVIMGIAFLSLLHDWLDSYEKIAFFNTRFLTGIFYVASFGLINKFYLEQASEIKVNTFIRIYIPLLLLLGAYGWILVEIWTFWDQFHFDSTIELGNTILYNNNAGHYSILSSIAYTLVFLTALTRLIHSKHKSRNLSLTISAFNVFTLLIALGSGLSELGDIRYSFINGSEYYDITYWNILIRYPFIVLVMALIYSTYQLLKDYLTEMMIVRVLLHIALLTILSNELIHWLELGGAVSSDKLGLSILWGIYGTALIFLGLRKNDSQQRFIGIGLFCITLVKLFIYDLRELSTLSKTVVMISLGIVLLFASFLYIKFKEKIDE